MGKPAKQKTEKKMPVRKEPTPSVQSEYQVSWLVGETNEAGKTVNGQWSPEDRTRTSFGRKALIKDLRDRKNVGQFKVRLAKKGS